MSRPEEDEILFAYIAVASHAVTLVLIRVNNDVQRLVYYLSKSLHEVEIRYLPLEKVILAVVHATRKLPHYFQSHTVVVLTQFSLRSLLRSADYTGMIAKWGTILGDFDIKSRNTHADSLATLATSLAQSLPRVILVKDLCKPTKTSVDTVHSHQIRVGISWMDSIVLFLKENTLPKEKSEADKVHRKAFQFWLSEDQKLYKRSFSDLYLLCIHPEAIKLLLEELHEGICESHTGGRSLSHKALTQGYWWPNMQKGAQEYVEAELLSNIRDLDTKRFVWKNIVTHLGIPYTLISDNGLQFDCKAFERYCYDLGITNRYSTPAYLQGSGQAEAVNKVIVNRLEKRLDDVKGKWVKELSHVLWTYRTTPYRSIGKTPFSMTYGAEAVIPLETGFPTMRTSSFAPNNNDRLLQMSLDFIEDRRKNAMVQLAYYQHKLKQEYDSNVKLRPLTPGDLVLRKVLGTAKNPAWGKLGPNWEGPYCITSVAGICAYYLEDLDESVVPCSWNVNNLRKYYY
ncbi:uncharacterized protein LOC142634750 [Castanea sativa]|uniref:uncharacterized protein LOC142634750 n=1 Tax=Castanea sativa TaxID=21020 RepID=UPI003F652699